MFAHPAWAPCLKKVSFLCYTYFDVTHLSVMISTLFWCYSFERNNKYSFLCYTYFFVAQLSIMKSTLFWYYSSVYTVLSSFEVFHHALQRTIFYNSSAGCTSQLLTKPIKQLCTTTPRTKLIIKLLLNLKTFWFFGSLGTRVLEETFFSLEAF